MVLTGETIFAQKKKNHQNNRATDNITMFNFKMLLDNHLKRHFPKSTILPLVSFLNIVVEVNCTKCVMM